MLPACLVQGVVHSGGVLADATILNQTLPGIRTAFAPKVSSAQLWERALGRQPGTMHVTFSSVAALLGSPGQANYSAANAVLDAMAQGWAAQGLAGLSVQWGAWAEGGMAAANAATAKAVERMGMGMIVPGAGLGAVQSLLLQQAAQQVPAVAAAVPFKWPRFLQRFPSIPPMFAEFEEAAVAAEQAFTPAAAAGVLGAQPGSSRAAAAGRAEPSAAAATAASATAQREYILGQVQEAVASVLGASVGLEDPLMAAGLDSLGSVELKNALEKRAGIELPSTLVFDYPTVSALAAYLTDKLALAAAPAGDGSAAADGTRDGLEESQQLFYYEEGSAGVARELHPAPREAVVHLVGASEVVVRSSGNALLSTQPSDQPRRIPVDRWDVEAHAELAGGLPVQFGVFLDGVELFDAAAMAISETEAALMDPQQRLLLECAGEALLAHPAEAADATLRCNWGVFVVRLAGLCNGRVSGHPASELLAHRAHQRRLGRFFFPVLILCTSVPGAEQPACLF